MSHPTYEKIETAANNLEDLLPVLRNIINEMRNGNEEHPMEAVYWFRKMIGKEVARLGFEPSQAAVKMISDRYSSWI
ncbi:MAG: hypothetical protein A2Y75_05440 [Candidatus Solincola sediminis]|uniref:Uncharacterized protein n=1 Tax=Candidatus Solincola sediminis TaxID=1797199 RepID=A0A1F2WG76_9ACTN|nr:MAG: hypothetical protein A2Y75_05440 [Candidatus Solincola sediminis]